VSYDVKLFRRYAGADGGANDIYGPGRNAARFSDPFDLFRRVDVGTGVATRLRLADVLGPGDVLRHGPLRRDSACDEVSVLVARHIAILVCKKQPFPRGDMALNLNPA
jgi:hypothetical protein